MLKDIKADIIAGREISKYHCNIIPAINGNSSLINGDFFQTGIPLGRSMEQNKKSKVKIQMLFYRYSTANQSTISCCPQPPFVSVR